MMMIGMLLLKTASEARKQRGRVSQRVSQGGRIAQGVAQR